MLAAAATVVALFLSQLAAAKHPHILLVIADDLGWNDVSWHYEGDDRNSIPTHGLQALVEEGVELNNHYVLPVCSPTRSAFMTGRYPLRMGMQQLALNPMYPAGVHLNETLVSELLQDNGYRSHLVGKWHIGFHTWEHTPLFRGYDSHFGVFNSHTDYYEHTLSSVPMLPDAPEYLDLWHDFTPQPQYSGQYITNVYANQAQEVVREHADQHADEPLFLHLALQQVHEPIMAPDEARAKCGNVDNENRNIYCGMVQVMQEAIINVTQTFKDEGMWEDTLMLFFSDNGGWVGFGSNNLPFKGQKFTLFEGGVRSVSFLSGGAVPESARGTKYSGNMHVTDWLPTLLSAAGIDHDYHQEQEEDTRPLDGVDQWDAIMSGAPSPREEIVLNVEHYAWSPLEARGCGIVVDDFKLLMGTEDNQHWRLPVNASDNPDPDPYAMFDLTPELPFATTCSDYSTFLYNLRDDPTESNNLADDPLHRHVLDDLTARLLRWEDLAEAPLLRVVQDPRAITTANRVGAWAPYQGDDLSQTPPPVYFS